MNLQITHIHDHRFVHLIIVLMLCLLLGGCGRPDTAEVDMQTATTDTPTATIITTATLPSFEGGATADAIKQAELDRIQHEVETAQAQPTHTTHQPIPTSTPYIVSSADLGISNN